MQQADIKVHGGGRDTVRLITPMTARAREWIERHVQLEEWQYVGPSIAVEHGFTEPLIEGMREAGLEVSA